MTAPTPEEQAETWKTFEERINARSEAKADNAADIKAAGGLASNKTLRDEFAEDALHGVIITCGRDTRLINETTPEMFARKSYQLADAMLEARKTTGGARHD